MGRLTERDEYGNADIIGVDSADLQLNLYYDEFVKVTGALNRLAAYEDSGLTPEEVNAYARAEKERRIIVFESYERMKEIQEIAMAERDGRLWEMPCKVGDTVYLVLPKCRASRIPLAECDFFECDDCPRNKREIFEQKATTEMLSMMLFEKYNTLYVFGKTVFLTRKAAEAEAALKGAEHERD